jgi:hypothetical protein
MISIDYKTSCRCNTALNPFQFQPKPNSIHASSKYDRNTQGSVILQQQHSNIAISLITQRLLHYVISLKISTYCQAVVMYPAGVSILLKLPRICRAISRTHLYNMLLLYATWTHMNIKYQAENINNHLQDVLSDRPKTS